MILRVLSGWLIQRSCYCEGDEQAGVCGGRKLQICQSLPTQPTRPAKQVQGKVFQCFVMMLFQAFQLNRNHQEASV